VTHPCPQRPFFFKNLRGISLNLCFKRGPFFSRQATSHLPLASPTLPKTAPPLSPPRKKSVFIIVIPLPSAYSPTTIFFPSNRLFFCEEWDQDGKPFLNHWPFVMASFFQNQPGNPFGRAALFPPQDNRKAHPSLPVSPPLALGKQNFFPHKAAHFLLSSVSSPLRRKLPKIFFSGNHLLFSFPPFFRNGVNCLFLRLLLGRVLSRTALSFSPSSSLSQALNPLSRRSGFLPFVKKLRCARLFSGAFWTF